MSAPSPARRSLARSARIPASSRRQLSLVAVLALLVTALTACRSRAGSLASTLPGQKDVELTFAVEDADAARDLRALVLRRLGAAQVGADVTEGDRRVSVVVHDGLARRVDELLTWTGTLSLLRTAPDAVLTSPDPASGVVARTSSDGRERWYEGSRAGVLRAIESMRASDGAGDDVALRVLAEPMWETSRSEDVRWRTRVVHAAPIGELGDGVLVGWGEGPTLRVRGSKGTAAAARIDAARSERVVVARGHVSLGAPIFEADALRLTFGAGAQAYARARRERQLLTTPRLPQLRRVDAATLPPNPTLVVACLTVPVGLSLAWLVFVRRFDRAHPEPMWLVGVTFLLGAAATVPAGLAEQLVASASPWLDPRLATFGGQTFALPLAIAVYTLVVGLSEEGSKRLAAQFAVRRPEFDEPVDGIVYGIVASLGFAAAENVAYFALGRLSAPLVLARCFMSVPAHMFFGALWGYALGAKLVDRRAPTWTWLVLAAVCHGTFDALLATEGAGLLAVLLNVALASAFVVLVRRALRHGVVTDEMRAIRASDRVFVRVGRPALFWASAVLVHVLAFGVVVLGAYYQLAKHRPSATFVLGSSALLALLAVAMLGVAEAVPLDVVIDDYGVTFAGAARPWRNILGFNVLADRVELDCGPSPVRLGPAAPRALRTLVVELERRLAR